MAADLEGIFSPEEFGESVTYTPADGDVSPFSVVAIFEALEIDSLEARIMRDVIICRIPQSQLSDGGVTIPTTRMERVLGDTITRGSDVWQIIDKIDNAGLWKLTLEKNIRISP
jgi:hypothetical protein